GKSTLAYTLMGHPKYIVTQGSIRFKGEDLLALTPAGVPAMPPDVRAQLGLFLAFQYPTAVPGVTIVNFLRTAVNAVLKENLSVVRFRRLLREKMKLLKINESFANRYLNDGFSGGEKKRSEVLQMAMLQPEMAILDETDSGLDIDALRIVAEGVNTLAGPEMGVLLITHYQRILNYITPDFVHVLMEGRIVRTGGKELAETLEAQGYEWITGATAEASEALA
ncbi:MAG: Fe-S cluster assembly ATPase SufC, partial [Dehalococcoidia bacterium]